MTHVPQLEKAHTQQQRPSAAKNNKFKKKEEKSIPEVNRTESQLWIWPLRD